MKRMIERAAVVLILAAAAACHEHDDGGGGADEYIRDCEGAGSGAFASDESYVRFVNAQAAGTVTVDDTRAPALMNATRTLRASEPPPIMLRLATMASRTGGSGVCRTKRERGFWPALRGALVLERKAHAHCPAVNGANYLFQLSNGTTPVYTAVLSVTTFTPDAKIWRAKLEPHVGSQLTLTLLGARFGNGNILEGPFRASEMVTFTVER